MFGSYVFIRERPTSIFALADSIFIEKIDGSARRFKFVKGLFNHSQGATKPGLRQTTTFDVIRYSDINDNAIND